MKATEKALAARRRKGPELEQQLTNTTPTGKQENRKTGKQEPGRTQSAGKHLQVLPWLYPNSNGTLQSSNKQKVL